MPFSGYKGVSFDKRKSNWRAVGQDPWCHLGNFLTEIQAALAYDEWAKKKGYTDDRLNFPKGPPALDRFGRIIP